MPGRTNCRPCSAPCLYFSAVADVFGHAMSQRKHTGSASPASALSMLHAPLSCLSRCNTAWPASCQCMLADMHLPCRCQRHALARRPSFLICCCGRFCCRSRLAELPRCEDQRVDGCIAGCFDDSVLRLLWLLPRIQHPGHLIQGHCYMPKAQGVLTGPVDLQSIAPGLALLGTSCFLALLHPSLVLLCTCRLAGLVKEKQSHVEILPSRGLAEHQQLRAAGQWPPGAATPAPLRARRW